METEDELSCCFKESINCEVQTFIFATNYAKYHSDPEKIYQKLFTLYTGETKLRTIIFIGLMFMSITFWGLIG